MDFGAVTDFIEENILIIGMAAAAVLLIILIIGFCALGHKSGRQVKSLDAISGRLDSMADSMASAAADGTCVFGNAPLQVTDRGGTSAMPAEKASVRTEEIPYEEYIDQYFFNGTGVSGGTEGSRGTGRAACDASPAGDEQPAAAAAEPAASEGEIRPGWVDASPVGDAQEDAAQAAAELQMKADQAETVAPAPETILTGGSLGDSGADPWSMLQKDTDSPVEIPGGASGPKEAEPAPEETARTAAVKAGGTYPSDGSFSNELVWGKPGTAKEEVSKSGAAAGVRQAEADSEDPDPVFDLAAMVAQRTREKKAQKKEKGHSPFDLRDTGRSGKRYSVEELQTLIKE